MELRVFTYSNIHIVHVDMYVYNTHNRINGELRVLTCTYGRKSESERRSLYEQEEKSDPFGSVVKNKVKASLLVVKLQVYDEVIFILELFYHLII